MTTLSTHSPAKEEFVQTLESAFEQSNIDFARAYYLFATAKLSDTYNSQAIYQRYPQLTDEKTFHDIKALYDQNAQDEKVLRLFSSVLDYYIGNRFSAETDDLENTRNQLKVDVSGMGLLDKDGREISTLLVEDTQEWMKKLASKSIREDLYQRTQNAITEQLTPKRIALFQARNRLLAELGYPDIIGFYSRVSHHALPNLGKQGKALVKGTDNLYNSRMAEFYRKRTGDNFSNATRADIAYVLSGKSAETEWIDHYFAEEKMVPLAIKTFDAMGLAYSTVSRIVDFKSREEYDAAIVHRPITPKEIPEGTILLDIAKRDGKRSRAFVYPSKVAAEIYLSVKPEGGLDDYSAFFHESGHALHFAYEDPALGYTLAMLGNNTVTEVYAYTFQNLLLNRHWLQHQAGMSHMDAKHVVQQGALKDLYMLRRYASKIQFELLLYEGDASHGISLEGKDQHYAELLTRGTGFRYDPAGWSGDVDAGFYVADYFTAWTLEAQLREYLCQHFGHSDVCGEDWYLNPEVGAFFKSLWKMGNLTQHELAKRLGSSDPNSIDALLRLMAYNLNDEAILTSETSR